MENAETIAAAIKYACGIVLVVQLGLTAYALGRRGVRTL